MVFEHFFRELEIFIQYEKNQLFGCLCRVAIHKKSSKPIEEIRFQIMIKLNRYLNIWKS